MSDRTPTALAELNTVDLRERIAISTAFTPSERDLLLDLLNRNAFEICEIEAIRSRRCEAEVADREIRERRRRDDQPMECQAVASYVIDGKRLCRRHAGFMLLDKLVKS